MTKNILTLLFASSIAFSGETFRIAVPFIPASVQPRDGQLNIGQYLSLQIYFPLLIEESDGIWQSHFLDMSQSKALNINFNVFRMCLKSKLTFSDKTYIKSLDLKTSLERFHSLIEQAPPLESIILDGDSCVVINLKKKSPRYFLSLQGTASTILKSSTENDITPIGLGPYKIKSFNQSKVELVNHKDYKVERFTKVIFEKISEANFNPNLYDDINPVFSNLKIANLTGFKEVEAKNYKSYALVVNIKDSSYRSCISNSLNISNLIQFYNLSLRPTPGFLPIGISGFNVKYVKSENCKISSHFKPVKMIIPLKNQYENIVLNKLAIFGKMARFISPELVDPSQMAKIVFSGKPYVSVIGFDSSSSNIATSSEASIYFESFFRENRLLSDPITGLESEVSKISDVFSKEQRALVFKKAHQITLDSRYVIPLGESTVKRIFPERLVEVVTADPISGYLHIDKIK